MARYAVTPEGISALVALAGSIEHTLEDMNAATSRLEETCASNADKLGPHAIQIQSIVSAVGANLRTSQGSVAELAESVRDVADSYQEILESDPYGSLGCSAPSAGVAGASSGGASAPPAKTRSEASLSPASEVSRPVSGLSKTTQTATRLPNGNTVFDTPESAGAGLNSSQGSAVAGFTGTCGLCSCENVARLAGKDLTEADVVSVARKLGACHEGSTNSGDNGGTSAEGRRKVLEALGIESVVDGDLSIDHIASEVEAGKGVIASVDVARFWPDSKQSGGHAITVTSVERDASGKVVAVYVCDSGTHGSDSSRRVDARTFVKSLTGRPLNVTKDPIR